MTTLSKREKQGSGGFIRFVLLIIVITLIIFISSDSLRPYLDTYVAEPARTFWSKAVEFVTGKTFQGIRNKEIERSTLPDSNTSTTSASN